MNLFAPLQVLAFPPLSQSPAARQLPHPQLAISHPNDILASMRSSGVILPKIGKINILNFYTMDHGRRQPVPKMYSKTRNLSSPKFRDNSFMIRKTFHFQRLRLVLFRPLPATSIIHCPSNFQQQSCN